ncbi:MAG: C25 family cysteine peptidase, partial [Pirellulales bacterium]
MIQLALVLTMLPAMLAATPDSLAGGIVVVCPEAFRPALAPWVAHRTGQGHRIEFVDNRGSAVEIRQAIRDRAKRGDVRFLLLVGDAEPGLERDAALRSRCIPTHLVTAKVNIRWGSEAEIAGDNWYADLDDDQLPDLAVGRLTADTPAELAAMVAKILRYETGVDFGRWRQRIHFIAGLGGFGALADATIEACAKKFITDGVPTAYSTTMTQASWRSPYCPDPREFGQTTLGRLNEGCLFWVYIGHGHARGLDRVTVPSGQYPILEMPDVRRMQCQQGSPIALF